MYLMHEDRVVLEAQYDAKRHEFVRPLTMLSCADAPIGTLDTYGRVTLATLNEWWHNRAIPASRDDIERLLRLLGVDDSRTLLEDGLGLSLSDTYWIKPEAADLSWAQVNFFENDFPDDLAKLTLAESPGTMPHGARGARPAANPSSSASGDLMKGWVIEDGRRYLLKDGRGFTAQEVYNERAASRLYETMMQPDEFVEYEIWRRGDRVYSACEDFLSVGEDLVSAAELVFATKRLGSMSNYDWCVAAFEMTGVENAELIICRMLACDFVLANYDRHYGNFGVVRDARSNTFVRMAPIYDSGNSLWCNRRFLETPADYAYEAMPFAYKGVDRVKARPERQLGMLRNWDWYEPHVFDVAPDIVEQTLLENDAMSGKRASLVCEAVRRNVQTVRVYADRAARMKLQPCLAHLSESGVKLRPMPWELARQKG